MPAEQPRENHRDDQIEECVRRRQNPFDKKGHTDDLNGVGRDRNQPSQTMLWKSRRSRRNRHNTDKHTSFEASGARRLRGQWLLAADADGRLHFAPLQGTTAAALRGRHPEIPQGIDTIVYVETTDRKECVSLRSEAIFRIYAALAVKSRLTSWLRLLPRSFTDVGYRLFSHVRYRLFGMLDVCPVPSLEQRDRFLP